MIGEGFWRAFATTTYLLGERERAVSYAERVPGLASALSNPDRKARAVRLARESIAIRAALDALALR